MNIWNEHSAKSVFMNARPGRGALASSVIDTPRNAYSGFQIALRFLENVRIRKITVEPKIGCEGVNFRIFRQIYTKYNDNTYYPDRLSELSGGSLNIAVPAHRTACFRIDFFIPESSEPGVYEYSVTVRTDRGGLCSNVTLRVHRATVSDPKDSAFGHEYFFNLELLPGKESGIKNYTEEWWKLLESYADVMKELRNNTVCIQPLPLLHSKGSVYNNSRDFSFNYGNFDRFVELFLEKGTARDFTLAAFIQSVEGKHLSALGPKGDIVHINTETPEADEYLRTFYGEIARHVAEKGWKDFFRVHIEDEPHDAKVWLRTKKILDEVAPNLVAGEPLDMLESAEIICENCKWAVPRINVYDKDPEVFKKFTESGNELWLYSCCFPEESYYLNKFVDLPAIRSRLMEWACVDAGAKGFLHWGFNFWGRGDSLYGFNADARFKGDGAIVYPNVKAGSLDLSSRFINTRDGLQDADLYMQIFANGSLKDVKDAKKLANSVSKGNFIAHSDDTETFNEYFKKLLEIADRI